MKKIISFIIMICLITAFVPMTCAEQEFSLLYDLGIFVGDGNGNMRWNDYVSRSEFAKLSVLVSSYRDYVASGLLVSPFSDVPASHWASAYIKTGVDGGLFTGYPDGKFRPDNTVTYEEALTMILRALGYNDNDFGASYPYGQVGIAKNIGITDGVDLNIGDTLNRYYSAKIIDNALDTKMKGSEMKLYTSFDCSKIENVTLIASNKEDSSVNSRQIFTSKGTFYINPETFDYSIMGKFGTLYLKNGDTFLSFEGSNQTSETYTVTDTMGQDLILDSSIKDIDEKTTVYYKSNTITYATSVNYAKKGDLFSIVKAQDGTTDYCILYPKNISDTEMDVNLLESYAVYSLIDSGLIVYANGVFSQIKIDDDVTAYVNTTPSIYATVKTSLELGDIIRIKRDSNNDIDYIKIEKGDIEGPVIASSDGFNIPGEDNSYLVLRDGEKVSFSDIRKNDVIYYSKELKMALAYNKTVVGTYEKAYPDKNSPITVTVSGTQYGIETAEAFNALSSNGKYKFGDTLKLLLGKDGKIAGISDDKSAEDVMGYLTEINRKVSTDQNGDEFTAYYAAITQLDGNTAEYRIDRNYSYKNAVVKIHFKDDGIGTLTIVSNTSNGITGKIDADLYTIGRESLSKNIKIIDVTTTDSQKEGQCKKIFLPRLDGVSLTSGDVLYYGKTGGEISELVLNNVTGDAYSYGVVTSADIHRGEMITGTYTVDINGTKMTLNGTNRTYNFTSGSAVGAVVTNSGIDSLFALRRIETKISGIDDLCCYADNTKYTLGENAAIYMRDSISTGYQKMPLSNLKNKLTDYNVYAYCDKSEEDGGRVRVIMADKK